MRREGSPWTGLWTVAGKEMSDHLSSARISVLEGLILLTALGSAYAATQAQPQAPGAARLEQPDDHVFGREQVE